MKFSVMRLQYYLVYLWMIGFKPWMLSLLYPTDWMTFTPLQILLAIYVHNRTENSSGTIPLDSLSPPNWREVFTNTVKSSDCAGLLWDSVQNMRSRQKKNCNVFFPCYFRSLPLTNNNYFASSYLADKCSVVVLV